VESGPCESPGEAVFTCLLDPSRHKDHKGRVSGTKRAEQGVQLEQIVHLRMFQIDPEVQMVKRKQQKDTFDHPKRGEWVHILKTGTSSGTFCKVTEKGICIMGKETVEVHLENSLGGKPQRRKRVRRVRSPRGEKRELESISGGGRFCTTYRVKKK